MADNRLPSFLIGLGFGATIGLLAAPKSGDQTRDDLRRAAGEGMDFVIRNSGQLRNVAEEAVDRGRGLVEAQRTTVESALRAGMDAYRRAAGENW